MNMYGILKVNIVVLAMCGDIARYGIIVYCVSHYLFKNSRVIKTDEIKRNPFQTEKIYSRCYVRLSAYTWRDLRTVAESD